VSTPERRCLGYATLQIDQPSTFEASVKWQNDGAVIDLNKLAADSYKYNSEAGVLDFFRNDIVVSSLRIDPSPATNPYTVAQGTSTGGAGIEIYSTNATRPIPHGADLPLHA
jgi:hypothetical protein